MGFEREQMDDLIDAVGRIAHGGVSGPTGLEALTMALIGGHPGDTSLTDGLFAIAEAIQRLADAVEVKE
jgi:hypothetical protein